MKGLAHESTRGDEGAERARALVDELASPAFWKPLEQLVAMGSEALPAVVEGLGHGDWRVRRGCLVYLDHHGDGPALERVVPLLRDPKSEVRLWAVHTLGCDRCKPGENPLDVDDLLIERALHDESIRVRRQTVCVLAWLRPPTPALSQLFQRILDTASDRKLRLHASAGLRRVTLTSGTLLNR
jgi:HEAT repeat protein